MKTTDYTKTPYLQELSQISEKAYIWIQCEMSRINKEESKVGKFGLCIPCIPLYRFSENILRGLMSDIDILSTIAFIKQNNYIPDYIYCRNTRDKTKQKEETK